jgi:hypothetical protein
MAFAIRNLSVLAYANGFTLWHYKSGLDERGKLTAKNFFAEAEDMLTDGDLMIANTVTGPVLMAMLASGGTVQAMIMR